MATLKAHLEAYLGQPNAVDDVLLDRSGRTVQLLQLDDQPARGAITLVTDGLRDLPHCRLHQELLVSCWQSEMSIDFQLVVELVARKLAQAARPLSYGDVIGPAGAIVPGSPLEAIFANEPTYFPEGFGAFDAPDRCRIRLMWLVPIYAEEARVVDSQGLDFFEDLLIDSDPDLLSLARPSVVAFSG